MSPTLSSELAIDTCPLLVNLQYLGEFQDNLLRGIDKCFGLGLICGTSSLEDPGQQFQ